MWHITRVRSYWADTAPSVKWVTYIFMPAGVVLGSAGLYGDAHGWWDERGFLTNLLSSAVSLLFGVPTALIVLGQLSAHQAEVLERRAVKRRARVAVSAYRHTLLRGFSVNDPELIGATLSELLLANHRWSEAVHSAGADEASSSALNEAQANRASLINTCLRLRRPLDVGEWLDEIVLRWRQLDGEIRPRIEETGLRWMGSRAYMTVHRTIGRIEGEQTSSGSAPFAGVTRDLPVLLSEEVTSMERERCRQQLAQQGEKDSRTTMALLMLLHDLHEIGRIAT
jgi:hypothetical protein